MLRKGWLFELFLVCVGVVFGSLVAELAKPVGFLSWLSYSLSFGLPQNLNVQLYIIDFSIGLQLNLSIAVILCVILSLLIGNLLSRATRK